MSIEILRSNVMAQCEFCGTETCLYDSEVPVCIQCSDRREAGEKLSKRQIREQQRTSQTGPQEAENKLLDKVRAARQQYSSAASRLADACNDQLNMEHPDGAFALRQAVSSELMALQEYANALRALADFVMRGKQPNA
jgi:hypothetical protein